MKKLVLIFSFNICLIVCYSNNTIQADNGRLKKASQEASIAYTKAKALEIMKTGFNAGDGYSEVWIRDLNTFIKLAYDACGKESLKENLLVFFRMQGDDGNILDGYTTPDKVYAKNDLVYSDLEPRYAGHKNTVETDQETSLVQAVYKYIRETGDKQILQEEIGGKTVAERMEWAMEFLLAERMAEEYGLIWGATTADWGDVQPEHDWGVDMDKNTHRAIDIYDNAMFIIALRNLTEMLPGKQGKWDKIRKEVAKNCMKYLWDAGNKKFIPHIYLENGSPFPEGFNENEIYYFGGTAIAIEAGLLTKDEIKISLEKMVSRMKQAGAASIGLTMYPAYPEGYFANEVMNPEYSYQNGGDWTWFGGRMIQRLVGYGFVEEAIEQLLPMTDRVKKNNGFYEWYTVDNKPRGSATFRGSAGVLYKAILMIEELRY